MTTTHPKATGTPFILDRHLPRWIGIAPGFAITEPAAMQAYCGGESSCHR